ncbi:hypothetical protein BU26DRAFT_520299 [Trematosphaeria pertusa]|uniref:RING-type domain-containing protein n=1 Tax=Trematosphaeria pertusa TaxID=390896 RepID=A0A6A6I9W5_9PLEO|nr:uncharacterized protein BU26DRAFT_520299 [Trematosphaeria pertusa]KAF2247019.1 hypothetical protein BU26DRAFT_520299 [Trematosphaeria pertusa]
MANDQTPVDRFLADPNNLTLLGTSTCRATNTECPICHEASPHSTESDTQIVKTTCDHTFHRECLVTWLQSLKNRDGTCPSCRAVLYRGLSTARLTDQEMEEENRELGLLMEQVQTQLAMVGERLRALRSRRRSRN